MFAIISLSILAVAALVAFNNFKPHGSLNAKVVKEDNSYWMRSGKGIATDEQLWECYK